MELLIVIPLLTSLMLSIDILVRLTGGKHLQRTSQALLASFDVLCRNSNICLENSFRVGLFENITYFPRGIGKWNNVRRLHVCTRHILRTPDLFPTMHVHLARDYTAVIIAP